MLREPPVSMPRSFEIHEVKAIEAIIPMMMNKFFCFIRYLMFFIFLAKQVNFSRCKDISNKANDTNNAV